MTADKKDKRKAPKISPVTEESDVSLEEESCAEACSQSGISNDNENASC